MDIEQRIKDLEQQIEELKSELNNKADDIVKVTLSHYNNRDNWRVFLVKDNAYLANFDDEKTANKCAKAVRKALQLASLND